MTKLNKQELKLLNEVLKLSEKTIFKFLKEDLNINLKEGYTKGNYSIYKGNLLIENTFILIGVEGINNKIINYEFKII